MAGRRRPGRSAELSCRTRSAHLLDLRSLPGTLLLAHALLSILLQLLWTVMPDGTLGIRKDALTGFVVAAAAMQGICILVPALATAAGYSMPASAILGRRRLRPGSLILSATLGIPAAVLLIGLNNAVVYGMVQAGLPLPQAPLPSTLALSSPRNAVLVAVVSVVIPGLVEELFFRGMLQGAMEHAGGRRAAVWLPAMAFALFHSNPLFLLAPLGAGLLLGTIRQATGSLMAGMATHMTMNLTILAMEFLLPRLSADSAGVSWGPETAVPMLTASLLAAAIAAVTFLPLLLVLTAPSRDTPRPCRPVAFPVDWRFWLACLLLAGNIAFRFFAA